MLFRKIKILFVLMPLISFAQEQNDINYTFTQSDSSYTFYAIFEVDANPECLLKISFEYEHVKALNSEAEDVKLMDEGNNWNKISFTYRKFTIFRNSSVWRRTLSADSQRVDFILESSENNQSIMPEIISSTGYYQIKPKDNDFIIEYYQQCQLTDELITAIYLNRVEKEAFEFIHRFSGYANAFCKNNQ